MAQKLKFADLYRNNCSDVEQTLKAMWCGETHNKSQKAYVKQIEKLIPEVFAPKDAMPLVQNMNDYKVASDNEIKEAISWFPDLWERISENKSMWDRPPYKHQYDCWNTLRNGTTRSGKRKSIVVYTGTGSGKTECFMLPLVQDLLEEKKKREMHVLGDTNRIGAVQAIFLYPLNALMEDQKERMQKLLEGTGLKFAVYNGQMPEKELNQNEPDYETVRKKIDFIRGIERDANGNIKIDNMTGEEIPPKFPDIIATREELRDNPPNILLTNPTMLEYMMLREKDAHLFTPKSLRWIVLDETHTYTGAAATEMAMLIRRLLMAYDVTTDDVRFATSSATIGKGNKQTGNGSPQAEETQNGSSAAGAGATGGQAGNLRKFIAQLTGLDLDQVEAVGGERLGTASLPNDEYKPYWDKLSKADGEYIRLDDLFDERGNGVPVEDLLSRLDNMCQKAEEDAERFKGIRVKVHFFYRVPNNGLYVDINDPQYTKDGSFKIYTGNHYEKDGRPIPLLELCRCKHCGEYLAIAEEGAGKDVNADGEGIIYQTISSDDSDMFDLVKGDETKKTLYVFGTTEDSTSFNNNAPYTVSNYRLHNVTQANPAPTGWHIVANTQCECPYCGTKLYKQQTASSDSPDPLENEEEDEKKLQKFRVPGDFISRLIAPSTLDLMEKANPQKLQILHDGQQYISFADSRQLAARGSLKQNLEQERLWVYSRIYHELCRLASSGFALKEAKAYFEDIYKKSERKSPEHNDAVKKLDILEGTDQGAIDSLLASLKGKKKFLTWKEIYDLLYGDPVADLFCLQFVERSENSDDLQNGEVTEEAKKKYILSLMVDLLAKRPLKAASPETMGLFVSYYEDLEKAPSDSLPEAVEEFNRRLTQGKGIDANDWRSLKHIFLDLTARSNESIFLKMDDPVWMDIFKCVRYATKKERRRTIHKPCVKTDKGYRSRIIRLLGQIIADDQKRPLKDAIKQNEDIIQKVIDCMCDELNACSLIEHSTHYNADTGTHETDAVQHIDGDPIIPYRLNVAKLGFKLYEDVYLCDTNNSKDNDGHHIEVLRPVETTFHGYSPYLINGNKVVGVDSNRHETWSAYPYYKGSGTVPTADMVKDWAKEKRKLLWDNNLWGKTGLFANRLLQIHLYPNLFIQSEHTAQVDKMIGRKVQARFKDHGINILACSTTMEMGVDLGSLELVMLSSVPPSPANYKQRAGRSGRRGQVRSVCVTLCSSDAIGMRALDDPMEYIINREIQTPTVDLNSERVIQRHVNAFLIREFGILKNKGNATWKVLDYYTPYELGKDRGLPCIKEDIRTVNPTEGIGEPQDTLYETFNEECDKTLDPELQANLAKLLEGTILSRRLPHDVVMQAKKMNEDCYEDLKLRLEQYADPYKSATSQKQRDFFTMKFMEPLVAQLLQYWANHRFTPNANMPTDIIEFDFNPQKRTMLFNNGAIASKPSYPLRTALSQYAPGNTVVRDGMVRVVRGIKYFNFFNPTVTFKMLYFDGQHVTIDTKLENAQKWRICGKENLELLQPMEFIPDMNESASRVVDRNVYTRVSAQLLGANEWKDHKNEPRLYDTRNNRQSKGQILYYNEGIGFGYCHCKKCYRTVLEGWAAATSSDPNKLPKEMNNIPSDDANKPDYHNTLETFGKKSGKCLAQDKDILRNVVLGDTITTDYTEIRIRHKGGHWLEKRNDDESLLITLGLLFTQAFAEKLGIERADIDFTITPNGHICVFDTNPGGSGYSNQLWDFSMMNVVIDEAEQIVDKAKTSGNKDALIDRSTLQHLNKIDLKKAKDWIADEKSVRRVLPQNVVKVFGPTAVPTSLTDMLANLNASNSERFIFVDDEYKEWNYDDSSNGWKGQFVNTLTSNAKGSVTSFCIARNNDKNNVPRPMPLPLLETVKAIGGWTKTGALYTIQNPYAKDELYPLVYIDGYLYFTTNPIHSTLNENWSNRDIYKVLTSDFTTTAAQINTTVNPATTAIFKLDKENSEHITTYQLGKLIHTEHIDGEAIINSFFEHCAQNPNAELNVSYQDEHMKSILSIVLALQTIEYFVKIANREFNLEFLIEFYDDSGNRWGSITANLPQSNDGDYFGAPRHGRDWWLENLAEHWADDLGILCNLSPIAPKDQKDLTHWRALTFECAGKRLCIYPDGGFMNGWYINDQIYYTQQNISYDANIKLKRAKPIKYDVQIENI